MGQAAWLLGTLPNIGNGSPSVDWPVQVPSWQHVPGSERSLEHEWKDGDPWRESTADSRAQRYGAYSDGQGVVRTNDWTAIMEGTMNA